MKRALSFSAARLFVLMLLVHSYGLGDCGVCHGVGRIPVSTVGAAIVAVPAVYLIGRALVRMLTLEVER